MPDASPIGLAWKVAVDTIPNKDGDTLPLEELEEESKDPRLTKDPQAFKDKKGPSYG